MLDYPDRLFTREAARRVDVEATERYGIPSIVLMENAASAVAVHAANLIRWPVQRRVLIFCGGGNNGGDGLAAARHLHNLGLDCAVVLTQPADAYRGDAVTNLAICENMKLNLIDAAEGVWAAVEDLERDEPIGLVIDALMGTGLNKPLRSPLSDLVTWVNEEQSAPVLAVDIPSGLDCDSGEALGGLAVQAVATATMVGEKQGFARPGVRQFTGEVHVVDIGVPRELIVELGKPKQTT